MYIKDRVALGIAKGVRYFADLLFGERYGSRAIVLETIAAVPGMVGGMLVHLKCLRRLREDQGWIKALLEEAENERMHLMTFLQIAKPGFFERVLIIGAQVVFVIFYTLLYMISPKTAHRLVGYLEEEAIVSYTNYLKKIKAGEIPNEAAPEIAKKYWGLKENARLFDVVAAVRQDEARHKERNHSFADRL